MVQPFDCEGRGVGQRSPLALAAKALSMTREVSTIMQGVMQDTNANFMICSL
jgi:hypothetical protein